MPNLLETGKFLSDYGVFAFIIVAFGALGIYLSVKFFLSLHRDIQDVTTITKQLGEKVNTEKGSPLIHYDLMRAIENELQELRQDSEAQAQVANKHYDIAERLVRGDAMLTCNVDKCPYMSKIVASLTDVVKKFDEFNIRAEDSRKATGASIEDIRKQNETLSREVSEHNNRLVNILSEVIIARGKNE